MKKALKLICIALTIILSAGMIIACSKKEDKNPVPTIPTKLTLTNEYVITIPANATAGEQSAAMKVQSALSHLGITTVIQSDSMNAKHEILIGQTSRSASADASSGLGAGDFTAKVSGTPDEGYKIALAASDDDGIELAAIYFIYTHLKGDTAGSISTTLTHTHHRADVMIAGTPLSAYSILYAKEGARADKNIEAAKYGDTVKLFTNLLTKATGITLTTIEDNGRSTEKGNLILFGDTSLKDDDGLYSNRYTPVGSYKVKLSGDKIILGGHNPCSALAAGEAFVNALISSNGELTELSLKGEKKIIKIGCVGDSITYGTGSTDPSMDSYPVYLQRMLGYDYYLEKYGAPSNSLIETDDPTFLKHAYFQQSVSARLDVVIIMLGTNDCRSQKWADSAHKDWKDPNRKATFLESGQKMIDTYRAKNKNIQIIWATCPTVPQDQWLGSDWTARLKRYGNPAIQTLAKNNHCSVIDIFTYSEKHPEMFEGGDGLHCKDEGYKVLAQGFYELTQGLLP